MNNDYITRRAAARLLGVSAKTVSTYAQEGRFEGAFKLGQAWAIPKESVEELADARPEGGFKRGRKRKGKVI